ncbi:LysR family transcriptional regulator [Gorillibacterium massiliense]|uniref:LysR family transcriptional regulator n=1 Tax=Gorillibacterium massiliense TaxID=1280390 RepID=UPI0004BC6454|nr:LysR family transcriptional regulator [Gorillibacterium massiliense]
MENLDVFAIVVEKQSINQAANQLNLSQPAVSRKIMSLEEELGVKLFERVGKRLNLTRAGRICYDYAVQMRDLERELIRGISRIRDHLAPVRFTLGASLTTLQSTLPDLITSYTAHFPETDIAVLTGKTHEIITLVKDKKVDLGIVASQVDHAGIHCVPLFDDHLCLVLPEAHPLLVQPSASMADLDGLPMILFSRGTWYRVLMDEVFHRFSVEPDVKMEIDSFEVIIRLLPSIRAAALLPMSYLRPELLTGSGLKMLPLPELIEAKRTTSLIFTEEAASSGFIQPFVDRARECFSTHDNG